MRSDSPPSRSCAPNQLVIAEDPAARSGQRHKEQQEQDATNSAAARVVVVPALLCHSSASPSINVLPTNRSALSPWWPSPDLDCRQRHQLLSRRLLTRVSPEDDCVDARGARQQAKVYGEVEQPVRFKPFARNYHI